MSAREAFARDYNVPRETMDKFDRYAALLGNAAGRFNLVARSTLVDLWTRHFADSAQVAEFQVSSARWLDLGTGAGLPGIVLALLGIDVDLIEANGKKAAFLQNVRAELDLGSRVRVHHGRIEAISPWPAPIITARAFAPMVRLFDLGLRFSNELTRWVLLKGARAELEIAAARRTFAFEAETFPSRTDGEGRIVLARSVRRKADRAALHR